MKVVRRFWLNIITMCLFAGAIFNSYEAKAQGLAKVRTSLETFRDELLAIAPIIAVIALILLGIAYATNIVEKSTFIRWAIGIIIVGSAAQITSIFMS